MSRSSFAVEEDELMTKYLNLLDRYQTTRQMLSQHLGQGYISLAEANFSNPARQRFGQNQYDDRMKCRLGVRYRNVDDKRLGLCLRRNSFGSPSRTDNVAIDEKDESNSLEDAACNKSVDEDPGQDRDMASRDPLSWFGILTPPALRHAQTHFEKAATSMIDVIMSMAELNACEVSIEDLRNSSR